MKSLNIIIKLLRNRLRRIRVYSFASLMNIMLKEEYRFHTSYTSKIAFLFFPIFAIAIGFFAGANIKTLVDNISLSQIKFSIHSSFFFYGTVAGAFGFLGKEAMKKFSSLQFLIHSQEILPVKLKTMLAALYVREILFYMLLTILPITAGLLLSIPVSHIKIISVMTLFISLTLAFISGIAFSFFATSIYRISVKIFSIAIGCGIFIASFLIYFFKLQTIIMFHSHMDFLYALAFISITTLLGLILIVEDAYEEKTLSEKLHTARIQANYSPLLIKEFLDFWRSNTAPKALFSFLFPLVLLTMIFWFAEKNITIGFNTISYSIFIGFFCLVIYSWLNNIDPLDFYDSLPTSTGEIIKIKLRVHLLISMFFAFVFVFSISALNNELYLFPLGIFVAVVNLLYISLAVAYLTGLRVNVYLFNPKLLIKFCIFAMLPQIPLSVLSFAPTKIGISFIVFVCALLLIASFLLWKSIDIKWKDEIFSM